MARRRTRGLSLAMKAMALGWEAQQVIAMRLLKVSRGGPDAAREVERMVSEKMAAGLKIGQAAATGHPAGVAGKALKIVGPPVRANRRRLSAELGVKTGKPPAKSR